MKLGSGGARGDNNWHFQEKLLLLIDFRENFSSLAHQIILNQ
jgi:hypothetical protein